MMHKMKQIAFVNASFIEADSRNFEIVIEFSVRGESDIVSLFYISAMKSVFELQN